MRAPPHRSAPAPRYDPVGRFRAEPAPAPAPVRPALAVAFGTLALAFGGCVWWPRPLRPRVVATRRGRRGRLPRIWLNHSISHLAIVIASCKKLINTSVLEK
jgi:hypothetical protein